MITTLDQIDVPQHFSMTEVSWAFYEHTLEQIGNRRFRVNFLDETIEITYPSPEHEILKKTVGRFVGAITFELGMPLKSLGSTTFRREDKSVGIEADECYYIHNIASVKGMKRFDPLVHPAPELAIEIDLLSSSIPREPIFARLGVPEIWRYNGERLVVRLLGSNGTYNDSPTSRVFPFLPMKRFAEFLQPMIDDDETKLLLEFRDWLRTLPPIVGSGSV